MFYIFPEQKSSNLEKISFSSLISSFLTKQMKVGQECCMRRHQSNRHFICQHLIQTPEIWIMLISSFNSIFPAASLANFQHFYLLSIMQNCSPEESGLHAAHQKTCIHWCFLSLRSFVLLGQKKKSHSSLTQPMSSFLHLQQLCPPANVWTKTQPCFFKDKAYRDTHNKWTVTAF